MHRRSKKQENRETLSENAEYDAAKDEQRDIEARIEELEAILKNAEVVVEDEVDFDKINIGCTVKVFDITFDEEMEFKTGRFYRGEQSGRKDLQRITGWSGSDGQTDRRCRNSRDTGWSNGVQGTGHQPFIIRDRQIPVEE